jgi:sugar phosphate isomerase/epimerase
MRDLRAIGYKGFLSIELFNPEYYKQDPRVVAETALKKTRAAIAACGSEAVEGAG